MRSIAYLNSILTVLALLLTLQLWTSWTNAPSATSPAMAQGIPDEGAQREKIIDQLKLLNSRADGIHSLLSSGKLRVRVQLPKDKE